MFQGDMFPKSKKFSVFEVICMKKKIILRGAVGFPIGVMIGYFISIIISIGRGICRKFFYLGNRVVELIKADGGTFCGDIFYNASDSLCHILDGAQLKRIFELFRHFCGYICFYMDSGVYHRQDNCKENERKTEKNSGK